MEIVFNSSPLIFLARLDFLEKFVNTSDNFYLPESVKYEINAKSDETSTYINRLITSHQLQVNPINLLSLAKSLNQRIGKGEAEAITLGIEIQADYIILDDFAARKEARRLGLNVKGTLAVIRKLHLEKKININDFEQFFQQLKTLNFRIKREIFDDIFKD